MYLTVLIPNYNGRDLLEKNLPSVYQALEYARVSYEIIIVDDASQDESVEYLQTNYPTIKVLSNKANKGFAKTCNKGIKNALGKYLLLLNSDIYLNERYIQKCLKFLETEPDFFGISGKIIDNSCSPIDSGLFYYEGLFTVKKIKNTESKATHFTSGANTLFSLDKLKAIGGFNTVFSPYYFEDDDLSYRAYKKGWKSFFIPDAICHHIGAATIKKTVGKQQLKQVYFSNKFIFNYMHTAVSPVLFDIKILLIDVLPKLIIGKIWVWKSYRRYKNKTKGVTRNSIILSFTTPSSI